MDVTSKTTATDVALAEELVSFIQKSPSMFHSAATIRSYLDEAGFTYLPETGAWDVEPGGSYYTCRNNSTVVAWKVGARLAEEGSSYHFQLAASHSDSPTFKLKTAAELEGPESYLRLDTERFRHAVQDGCVVLARNGQNRAEVQKLRQLLRVGGRAEHQNVTILKPACAQAADLGNLRHGKVRDAGFPADRCHLDKAEAIAVSL